jgi:hypothetical protein
MGQTSIRPPYLPTSGAAATETIREATLATNWTTVPDATSVYAIKDLSNACYNTRNTCQDIPNYNKTTKEYKFCQPLSNLPIGEPLFPALYGNVQKAPTTTTGGKGLGNRAVVSVKIKDFPHHDRGVDPYWATRTFDAETQGTFWGKWLARNIYYEGRTLKLYYGYNADTFSIADFQVQEYDITDISGPDNGMVTVTAKDALIRTYDSKAQYPAISSGKLLADITDVATTATLTPTGIGNSDYPASGYVSIGKEAMTFTRSADVLTLTRAQWGTEAKAHTADDVVQISPTWTDINVVDMLYELLVTGAGLPVSMIPYDDGATGTPENWDDEKSLWLSASLVNGILMKPESIDKIISEISEQFMFDIWWDATTQEVKIKALSPEPSGVTITTLTDGYNILADSVKVKPSSKQRLTEVQVWYGKLDYSGNDDLENYGLARISADTSRAGADRYGANSIKVIPSRWINNISQASQLSGRLLARFSDTPNIVSFKITPKDEGAITQAGRVQLDTWKFQDVNGANAPKNFQITKISENDHGNEITVECLTSSFSGRYGFVTIDAAPDYTAATESEKGIYGYICLGTGLFSDGSEGYKVI